MDILKAGDWRSAAFLNYLDQGDLEDAAVLQAHLDESSGNVWQTVVAGQCIYVALQNCSCCALGCFQQTQFRLRAIALGF